VDSCIQQGCAEKGFLAVEPGEFQPAAVLKQRVQFPGDDGFDHRPHLRLGTGYTAAQDDHSRIEKRNDVCNGDSQGGKCGPGNFMRLCITCPGQPQ